MNDLGILLLIILLFLLWLEAEPLIFLVLITLTFLIKLNIQPLIILWLGALAGFIADSVNSTNFEIINKRFNTNILNKVLESYKLFIYPICYAVFGLIIFILDMKDYGIIQDKNMTFYLLLLGMGNVRIGTEISGYFYKKFSLSKYFTKKEFSLMIIYPILIVATILILNII